MRSLHRYVIFGVLFLMLGGVIGVQAWLSLAFIKKQRIALLNDVNHTVAETGAMQLNATFLLASETAHAKAIAALFGTGQIHPIDRPTTETHLLGLQVFRKEGDHFVEEKLPADNVSMGYTTDVIGSFLSQAEKNQRAFWQAAKTGGAPRFFLATRLDAQATDRPLMFVAVCEIDPQLLVDHLQSASLFDTYLVTRSGQVLFHLGGSGNKISREETASVSDLMKGRGPASSGLVSYKADGQEWYGAVAPVGASDFYLLSRAGSTELGVAVSPLIQIALALGAVALLASLFASYFAKLLANRFLATYAGAAPLTHIPDSDPDTDSNWSAKPAEYRVSPAPAEIHVPPAPAPTPDPPEENYPVIEEPPGADDITQTGFVLNEKTKDTDTKITKEEEVTEKPLVEEGEDLRRLDE